LTSEKIKAISNWTNISYYYSSKVTTGVKVGIEIAIFYSSKLSSITSID
jgi:hypothetical protein